MTPWTVACQTPGLWNSPGKTTGVGSHSLPQGIFLTHGSNLGRLHCDKMFDDTAIRYILDAFPYILKNKGSLRGIQYAINTYLKIYDVRTSVMIFDITNAETIFNIAVDDHTLVIALNQSLKDIKILEELLRYVMPIGYSFQFYYYNTISDMVEIITNQSANLIFVSDNINAMVRQEHVVENNPSIFDRLVGAVDTVNIASTDSKPGVE